MDRPVFPFMAVNGALEILNDCCYAVTANCGVADSLAMSVAMRREAGDTRRDI
jgi:hypothetical protein